MASGEEQIPNRVHTATSQLVREQVSEEGQFSPQDRGSYNGENQISLKLDTLSDALNFHMSKHGDTNSSLVTAVLGFRDKQRMSSLRGWRAGKNIPRRRPSLELFAKIELHYQLPCGYFAKLITKANPSFKKGSRKLSSFHAALNFQMQLHEDSSASLAAAVAKASDKKVARSITRWKTGHGFPRYGTSFVVLEKIERHYQLPIGHFTESIAQTDLATRHVLSKICHSHQSIYRWHLPADFERRSPTEQKEIDDWISTNIIGGATEFGKYQRGVTRHAFAIVFRDLDRLRGGREPTNPASHRRQSFATEKRDGNGTIEAPSRLAKEMADLIAFKTAILPPIGYRRYLRWESVTAQKAVCNYGILFGALVAAPMSPAAGLGVPLADLTFGLLVFPAIWDWYLHWRERRRGFFTMAERSFLYDAKGFTRDPTGWVRQHPELAEGLRPIEGLVSHLDISKARCDWNSTCDKAYAYICDRISELLRVIRMHRDPYEAILPVLNSSKPLDEYKKIADEIIRQMPDEKHSSLRRALAIRSYLVVRFAMQLGIRQRNLRELLLCIPGDQPRTSRKLEELRRGELRWSKSEGGWEIFIPAVAFKNGGSSYFKGRPFRLTLSDVGNLYSFLDIYINKYRSILLAGHPDPGTFFVRSARSSRRSMTYDMFTFYGAWRTIIQRYGIFNPYTGRGAIAGLLPHGPHCVRDVIATHVLKQTKSYELAGFAIQDTIDSVVRHYSRFQPEEKAALAAQIVDRVWQTH